MGSFTPTTPSTAKTQSRSAAKPASGHADQIQGAPAPSAAASALPAYSHADQIGGAAPSAPGIMPGEHDETMFRFNSFPDPAKSPWLNPGGSAAKSAPFNPFDPFGGAGADIPATAGTPTPQLPPPPPLPPRPGTPGAPAAGPNRHMTGDTAQPGVTPIYTPNEAEGGGNSAESAAYVQKKNADARRIAKTERALDTRRNEAREKQHRAEQKAAERAQRWHAEEMAEAQKDMTRRREQLAQVMNRAVATKVKQLMEPADHPGLSDDAKIVREARRAPLSAEAAASNDRQVKALGRIGGVGDLPVYTADAAENYGDTGIGEVADPESSSGQA